MPRALLIALLALASCRNMEVSPGRERAIGQVFRCTSTDEIPDQVRALLGGAGIRLRETGDPPSVWIAAGERAGSEFAVQIVGPDATIALYTRRGTRPTESETGLMDRLSALFSHCERQSDPIR